MGYGAREDPATCRGEPIDPDPESDSDEVGSSGPVRGAHVQWFADPRGLAVTTEKDSRRA